jgi:hypothetical protein
MFPVSWRRCDAIVEDGDVMGMVRLLFEVRTESSLINGIVSSLGWIG